MLAFAPDDLRLILGQIKSSPGHAVAAIRRAAGFSLRNASGRERISIIRSGSS
jgi:hypothetical protein